MVSWMYDGHLIEKLQWNTNILKIAAIKSQ